MARRRRTESVEEPVVATDLVGRELERLGQSGPPLPPENLVGVTMFDLPLSEDGSLTVLLAKENVRLAAAQSLVRIDSREDHRRYLAVVTAGPFAEPDAMRADSAVLVTVATRGGSYLPPYHGRVKVTLLGELLADGTLAPHRLRPLPHSPVFRLTDAESAAVLKSDGDIRLGLAVGHEGVIVGVPTDSKAVLPRHTAILGTTGAGKSTTVANLVQQAQAAGMAVVLLDVEGEYTFLHEPTADPRMQSGLRERALPTGGVDADAMTLYHLVRRGTANPNHPNLREFTLQFAKLSPYAVMEILNLSEAQQERYLKAHDICKEVMRDLSIFPTRGNAEQERMAMELDEFERGYPRMTLTLLMDVVGACMARADRATTDRGRRGREEDDDTEDPFHPQHPILQAAEGRSALRRRLHGANPPAHVISWRALQGRLARLARLGVFYNEGGGIKPLNYKDVLRPGAVSVIDLSESAVSELNNIVIADLLRGIQEAQDEAYGAAERGEGPAPTRLLVVIEEAHEFLSAERIEKMAILFEQVARIAKRGRKRWLGLVFVTQLPGHLPRQIFGLVNSYILHKITDPLVLGSLRKTVHGIDEGLWNRLAGLAPGQAVVSFPHMTRPLLVSMDPARGKLRLVE
jgi:uncharacterized protein